MVEPQLDLRALAVERPIVNAQAKPARRKPWVTRYVVPGVVLLGFTTLLVAAGWEQFLPRQPVTVVPVVVARAEVQQVGTPLFQAAGWVEPRPTSVNVAALTQGVVEQLLVVEGQQIKAGEPVAKLVDVDTRLALRQAENALQLRQAELQSAEAQRKAAQLRVDNPAHLQAALADAQSLLAKTQTQIAQLPFLIRSAEAEVDFARQNLDGKQSAMDAIAARLIQQARSELAAATAKLEELQQRQPLLEREAQALQNKTEALKKQVHLLIEENRQLDEANARLKVAQARLAEAKLGVEVARLALERTTVRAPIDGRVLSLVAHPGTRVTGQDSSAGQDASTVVSMYDPRMLQVRADVRLEDIPMVQPGQAVVIETASSSTPISGTVLMPTSAANIQKNTLEVKVAINDPPPTIRPEMLVTATFLAPQTESSEESEELERLLIPRQLVQTTENGSSVWMVDVNGLARRQPVKLGRAGTGQLVEVTEGIQPTDKLIASGIDGLDPGSRVVITGEDATIGMSAN